MVCPKLPNRCGERGDGGFMMNSQMETAVRLKLNLVILILEDSAYGMIRWKQAVDHFPNFGLTFFQDRKHGRTDSNPRARL
jgi:thiamine pyrophosphate-dependent acetolactate synthase large subunit-like protein